MTDNPCDDDKLGVLLRIRSHNKELLTAHVTGNRRNAFCICSLLSSFVTVCGGLYLLKAWENTLVQGSICFGFASHWSKRWHELSNTITNLSSGIQAISVPPTIN